LPAATRAFDSASAGSTRFTIGWLTSTYEGRVAPAACKGRVMQKVWMVHKACKRRVTLKVCMPYTSGALSMQGTGDAQSMWDRQRKPCGRSKKIFVDKTAQAHAQVPAQHAVLHEQQTQLSQLRCNKTQSAQRRCNKTVSPTKVQQDTVSPTKVQQKVEFGSGPCIWLPTACFNCFFIYHSIRLHLLASILNGPSKPI